MIILIINKQIHTYIPAAPSRSCPCRRPYLGGTQTGSYQTRVVSKGPLYPSETKTITCFAFGYNPCPTSPGRRLRLRDPLECICMYMCVYNICMYIYIYMFC